MVEEELSALARWAAGAVAPGMPTPIALLYTTSVYLCLQAWLILDMVRSGAANLKGDADWLWWPTATPATWQGRIKSVTKW